MALRERGWGATAMMRFHQYSALGASLRPFASLASCTDDGFSHRRFLRIPMPPGQLLSARRCRNFIWRRRGAAHEYSPPLGAAASPDAACPHYRQRTDFRQLRRFLRLPFALRD